MNASTVTHVGMDVHAKSIQYSVRFADGTVVDQKSANSNEAATQVLRKIAERVGGPVRACYEAGPTGFGLQRWLRRAGIECVVIAPSLTPQRAGDHCKTDPRDARKLRELDEAGLLSEVHVPTPAEEAARSLTRRLESVGQEIGEAKVEIKSLLLRLSIVATKKAWSLAHRQWLEKLALEEATDQAVLEDCLLKLRQAEERQGQLRKTLEAIAEKEPFATKVAHLRCFKGVDTVTAMTIAAELVSPERFRTARQVMSYAGLTVSLHWSGESRRQGGITKAGNAHLRRVLVCAAKHASKSVLRETKEIKARRKDQPAWIREMARKAERRLHARHERLVLRGKNGNVATTAVARELAGFAWAALTRDFQLGPTWPADVDADGVVIEN